MDAIAEGPRNARVRTYLKSAAKTAWELVQWLTHDSEASRYDAELALDATQGVISALGMAIVRHEKGSPHRCPSCGSYKLFSDYRPETNDESPYVTVCTVCAWEDEA